MHNFLMLKQFAFPIPTTSNDFGKEEVCTGENIMGTKRKRPSELDGKESESDVIK